jgi:hypothetical protein
MGERWDGCLLGGPPKSTLHPSDLSPNREKGSSAKGQAGGLPRVALWSARQAKG